ncbi:MAG: hypothetical protein ACE5FI_19665, partial [Anaerolineales bacterium]
GAARINLALLVSTSLEFNSMLCGYKGADKRRPGAIRHTFALHAYSFPYTCAENNPVNPKESSGNLRLLFRDRIKRGRKWSLQPVERKIRPDGKTQLVQIPGEFDGGTEVFNQSELVAGQQNFWLIQGDSRQLLVDDHSVDFIVTDPPYYDSVQYSDLAAFFRVWLAKMLPGEANWTYDTSLSAVATQQSNDDTNFMRVLGGIFGECGRILKHDTGRLVFTFHHWDPNAWAELTIALKQADFRLRNAYVVFSENPISVHINNLRAIKHDAILVLALDGVSQAKRWTPIDSIAAVDSATFCWQCSHALGWMLESALSDADIRTTWDRAINSDKSRDISKA